MDKDLTPVSFRMTVLERSLVTQAARHQGQSLSAFLRQAAIDAAADIVRENRDEILRQQKEILEMHRRQIDEEHAALEALVASKTKKP